jgi:hypothetical protein
VNFDGFEPISTGSNHWTIFEFHDLVTIANWRHGMLIASMIAASMPEQTHP